MVQEQVFLKGWEGRHFSYLIFSRLMIFIFRNYSKLIKTVLYL